MTMIEKSRWIAAIVLAGAAAVLYLVGRDLERTLPDRPEIGDDADALVHFNPLLELYSPATLARIRPPEEEQPSPFFTTHFDPPPPKLEPEPPPPSDTRRIEVVYQGFFEMPEGQRTAYVLVENKLVLVSTNATLVADYVVADITARALVLTREETDAILPFRSKEQLEVPAR